MKNAAILLITCPDHRHLVAATSDFVFRHNGNILHVDEHADEDSNLFLMRLEFDPTHLDIDLADFSPALLAHGGKVRDELAAGAIQPSPENGDSGFPVRPLPGRFALSPQKRRIALRHSHSSSPTIPTTRALLPTL